MRAAATYAARTASTSCGVTLAGVVRINAGAPATPSGERRKETHSRGRPSMARSDGTPECRYAVLRLRHCRWSGDA